MLPLRCHFFLWPTSVDVKFDVDVDRIALAEAGHDAGLVVHSLPNVNYTILFKLQDSQSIAACSL